MELQGAAGGHLEVLQQVPESCIRKIIFYLFSGLIICFKELFFYSSRACGAAFHFSLQQQSSWLYSSIRKIC
jgi:hypothetical protein